jgi:hypothetical protein
VIVWIAGAVIMNGIMILVLHISHRMKELRQQYMQLVISGRLKTGMQRIEEVEYE